MSQAKPVSKRYHDLDALRAFAMMAGIFLHAIMFLLPLDVWVVQDPWAVATEAAKNLYGYLFSAIHGFRMPLFFMLSGFFVAMMWQKRGSLGVGKHRLQRILLPLVICMFTVIPVSRWLLYLQYPTVLDWLTGWTESLVHLWFLWQLLLISGVIIVALELGLTFRHRIWLLLLPATAVIQYFMTQGIFGADVSESMIPPARIILYYLTFFTFGVHAFQREIAFGRWLAIAVLPGLLLFFPAGMMSLYPDLFLYEAPPGMQAISAVLQTTYTWLMCFGFIGLFQAIASKERYWVRYASDASYWFYICHVPLVLCMQILIVDVAISPHLKVVIILSTVIGILLVTYQYGVRYTLIGRTLNGPRTPRTA